jgi:O-antigen ligase
VEKSLRDFMQFALVSTRGSWKLLATLVLCLLVGMAGGALLAVLTAAYTAALVIALIGGLLMLRDTQWGFIALVGLICLLPFAAVPLGVGFEPTFLDLVLLVIFFVWISRIATRRQAPFVASPLALPIIAFLALIVVSFIAGLGHASITTTLLRKFAELILGICTFFAVINCIRTREQLRRIVLVLILAGFVAALVGVVLYFLPTDLTVRLLSVLRVVRYPAGSSVLRYIEDNAQLALRATSTSQDPNVLGGLLILVIGITVPQLMISRPLLPKKILLPMVAVMLACLVLTYSRAAMAGVAVGLAAISLFRYRRLGLFLLGGAALFLLLPATQGYIQRFVEGVQGQDLATQMRFGEYRDAITIILRHPWLGVGFAGTPEINMYVGVSSVYLLIAEETGVMGLVVFCVIMAILFVQLWQARKRVASDPLLEAIFWGALASILGALVGGVLDHYFFNLDFSHAITIFWFYVGLGITIANLAKNNPAPSAGVNLSPRGAPGGRRDAADPVLESGQRPPPNSIL